MTLAGLHKPYFHLNKMFLNSFFSFALGINSVFSNVTLACSILISAMLIMRKCLCSLSLVVVPCSAFCIIKGLTQGALYSYLPCLILDDITWKVLQKSLHILKLWFCWSQQNLYHLLLQGWVRKWGILSPKAGYFWWCYLRIILQQNRTWQISPEFLSLIFLWKL